MCLLSVQRVFPQILNHLERERGNGVLLTSQPPVMLNFSQSLYVRIGDASIDDHQRLELG